MFERGPVRVGELSRREQVDGDPDERDDEHDHPGRRGRVDQASDPLVDDQRTQHQQRRAVRLR